MATIKKINYQKFVNKTLQLYNKGFLIKEIAERFNVHTEVISFIIRNEGLSTKKNAVLKKRKKEN